MTLAVLDPRGIALPGIATVHSHAFQRALRGRTQRRVQEAGSFWSWRGLMFALAEKLDPETLYDLSHYAFVELALSGVTCVGEFHYVHHDAGGVPYGDRTVLAEAVTRAALDAGLRITLLRVVYQRAGYGRVLEAGQRRFVDVDLDDALRDVEALAQRYAGHARVKVGLAPHSARAVDREGLRRCAAFAQAHAMPLHSHVSEQRRELFECLAEYGVTPVELFDEVGALDARFTGVHATHLRPGEAERLGKAGATACVCRTTERDLGDGFPDLRAFVANGVRLTVGTDSHASSDPFEEARAMELDERCRVEARHAALEAPQLLEALTAHGYAALGWDANDDRVVLREDDPALAFVHREGDAALDDVVAFHASGRAVRDVWVGQDRVVEDGRHAGYERARERYVSALRRLM